MRVSNKSTPFGLKAWSAIAGALEPFAPLLLRQRAARGKEDSIRRGERMGYAARPRPDGRLVWLHGASVGESLAALPLVSRLMADGFHVLVTSGTVTSATLLAQRLPADAIHHYVPLDTPRAVARFLDHWKPEAGLFVESDLWPNLIGAAQATSSGQPVLLPQCPRLRPVGAQLAARAQDGGGASQCVRPCPGAG